MRKLFRIFALVLAIPVVLLALRYGSCFCINPLHWPVALHQAELTAPGTYQPAEVAIARLCQSDPALIPGDLSYRPAWLPPEILRLEPSYVSIRPDAAMIGFGGGFHHYSYVLSLDKAASRGDTNWWVLELDDEYAGTKTLHRFSLPQSERFTLQQLIEQTLAEYHRRASDRPKDDDIRSRLQFLLKSADADTAVRSIHEFATRYPHDWLDQLLLFVATSKRDPAARDRLNGWASLENDFSSWLLAAYAYEAAGDPDAAENCVTRALATPPNDPDWMDCHARYRGAAMCCHLYENRRYETCIALCNALLNYQRAGKHLEQELRQLRDTAQAAAKAGSQATPATFSVRDQFDPFERIDLPKLLKQGPGSQPS